MNILQRGIWSGTIATSVMTLAFAEFFPLIPKSKQSPLPPGTITDDLLKEAGLEDKLRSEGRQATALLSHFAYGIFFASIYSALAPGVRTNAAAKGSAFGLFVWASSYLGLLPALGLRPRANNMPWEKNLFMIFAHIAWGVSLGISEERLRLDGKKLFDGRRKSLLGE